MAEAARVVCVYLKLQGHHWRWVACLACDLAPAPGRQGQ